MSRVRPADGAEAPIGTRGDGHRLERALDHFPDARVVCLGDVMLDRYVYGRVERVSAEAPIPIIHTSTHRDMLGGAGNVSRNVVALGAEAILIGVTGDDHAGERIARLADSEDRLTSRLVIEAGRSSTVKTRYVADGQQLLRADDECVDAISNETAARVMDALRAELPGTDVLVLSDYMKGVLADDVLAAAIAEAGRAGVPVIADPKRADFSAYAGVTLLKPNQAELAVATRSPCRSEADIEDAARKLMEACAIDAVMVSRSKRGLSLFQRTVGPLHVVARALDVFDVSGAGDTVVSTAAVALASGADLEAVAELANAAGGIVVGKLGTATVSRSELAARLFEMDVSSSEAKITSAESAEAIVAGWRARGQRVGFTNGCFDLVHAGHVSLLTEARSACDRLIVAMNGDASVRRLKGPGRPVQQETARAIVLASLEMVDMVIVFSEDTPIPLLERLRPDVLLKGGDYTIDQVVGADVVRAYGGEIRLAKLVPGHSSTAVIAEMSSTNELAGRASTTRSPD